jgi:hypothetical protein
VKAAIAEQTICVRCGAVLASDHAGESLCSPCAKTAPVGRTQILDSEQLAFAVMGVLLLHRGLRPGRRVPIRRVLARLGVEAQSWEIHHAVEKVRLLGLSVEASERRPGYRALDFWRRPLGKSGRRRRAPIDGQWPLQAGLLEIRQPA